jgi:ankyrin repeat protein
MRATEACDERRVRELLAAGAPLHCVNGGEQGRAALHYASLSGDARVITALLEAGAAVDAKDRNGETPLIIASAKGHEGVVRALLARGARLDPQLGYGGTALHEAAFRGHAGVVELLCASKDAVVDVRDSLNKTPLRRAIEGGHEAAFRALLARGARQDIRDSDGATLLHHAAECGHAGIVDLLCGAPGADVDAQDRQGHTPLVKATNLAKARGGAVRALLAHGARQELQNSHGWTALHWGAYRGQADVVELLCAAPGAPVDVRNGRGDTPLILATMAARFGRKNEGVVGALLARGARQDLQASGGRTALHWAVSHGNASIAELLCAAPGAAASLTIRDDHGRTPLALAALMGCGTCAVVLRAHGAAS